MPVAIEFSGPIAHGVNQLFCLLSSQSVPDVFGAEDRMGSPLFVIDVAAVLFEYEARGLNFHEVSHDLAHQWLRHARGESDVGEEPLPSTFKRT